MRSVWVENFRCFRHRQTARMAPLTLLVGENSTGKTSFLALILALWNTVKFRENPDFQEPPYDLGGFDQIAHYRGRRGSRSDFFSAGFRDVDIYAGKKHQEQVFCDYEFRFEKEAASPFPVRGRLDRDTSWIEWDFQEENIYRVRFGTTRGVWETTLSTAGVMWPTLPFRYFRSSKQDYLEKLTPLSNSPAFSSKDMEELQDIHLDALLNLFRPFASAPVRSEPQRTYNPYLLRREPAGNHVAMHLAHLSFRDEEDWRRVRETLERFGEFSGLFDEISVKLLGDSDSDPFQMQVKKYGEKLKGPWRNLIDVGYGVSQALPVITELLTSPQTPLFLLQQPEVHLHPSAQAALGSLFCEIASWNNQLVVETHSDHLIDRVRMDVRDGKSRLTSEDVSILYFERDELDVRIFSLGVDRAGNIVGIADDGRMVEVPDSYRRFFMEETTRSLGL